MTNEEKLSRYKNWQKKSNANRKRKKSIHLSEEDYQCLKLQAEKYNTTMSDALSQAINNLKRGEDNVN